MNDFLRELPLSKLILFWISILPAVSFISVSSFIEFVLIIPARAEVDEDELRASQYLSVLLAELPLKQAVQLTSKLTGAHRNELYALALTLTGVK